MTNARQRVYPATCSGTPATQPLNRGWSGLRNREVLDHAEEGGYDLLVTTDHDLGRQEDSAACQMEIIVLLAAWQPRIQRRVDGIQVAGDRVGLASALKSRFEGGSLPIAETIESGLEQPICTTLAWDSHCGSQDSVAKEQRARLAGLKQRG